MTQHIGRSVFVTFDNIGCEATIIDYRDSEEPPRSHYKVRTDTGDEFWAHDFEIDFRSEYDSRPDTEAHIKRVRQLLEQVICGLEKRGDKHDESKLVEPEKSVFDIVTPRLRQLTYGSDEYKASLTEMGEALDHHYANNSHHPQHYANGFDGMSLLDVIEMLADWKAAGERHADGSLEKSLDINKTRFGLSEQVWRILDNTRKEMGW